ncbi:MAG: hypothetical protein ABEJ59_04070 [Halanaeroarchaeum sp.]
MADRAVSDVLGYALVFAMIVSLIGFVYASGMGGLTDVRQSEKLTNAERAFDVLDANLDDIAHGRADSRGTEIKLQDAALDFGDPVTINVSVAGGDYYAQRITPITYRSSDAATTIVAVDGAVLRQESTGSAMLRQPGFVFGDETVVPMVVTRTRDAGVSGSGRVLVRTVAPDRNVRHFATNGAAVTIRVTTPRPGAWSRYLSEQSGQDCTVSGSTVECTVSPDDVYVQVVYVDVSLE